MRISDWSSDVCSSDLVAYAKEKLEPELKAIDPACGFTFTQISGFPGLATPDSAGVISLGKVLTGANRISKVSFGTEAGLFSETRTPTILCAPGLNERAHNPTELIEPDQYGLCKAFIARPRARVRGDRPP